MIKKNILLSSKKLILYQVNIIQKLSVISYKEKLSK